MTTAEYRFLSEVMRDLTMTTQKYPPATVADWIEFAWLLFSNPTFQTSTNKRKAYFEYRLAKLYNTPFC